MEDRKKWWMEKGAEFDLKTLLERVEEIYAQFPELRKIYAAANVHLPAKVVEKADKPVARRAVSPDGKRRIAAAARKRWAEYRKAKAAATKKAAKKK